MVTENPFQYESCPECGMLSFMHNEGERRHVCVNEECGYVTDDDDFPRESIWVKILKILKIKKRK